MKMLLVAVSAIVTLALPASFAAAGGGAAAPPDTMLVRPGDTINTAIMGYVETSGTWSVDPAGDYQMAALDKLHVGGLTDAQAEEAIRQHVWALYRSQPMVTVHVMHRVSVLGQVRSPGLYWIDGTERVTEVLARAGGATDQASLGGVRVTSEDGSRKQNVASAIRSGRTTRDLGIRSGDVIYVPSRHALSDWRNWATVASIVGSLALIYDVTQRNNN